MNCLCYLIPTNNTLNNAPTISLGTSKNAFVRIAQMCLMCMMETDPGLDGIFNSSFQSKVKAFQSFYCLSSASSGVIDIVTWASLLSSKGLSTRPALACDASTQLNASMAQSLYNNGYRYIGRYLTGTVGSGATERPKNLTRNELNTIFDAGLNVFAIFQEGAVTLTKFTYSRGLSDAAKAVTAAQQLGIPRGEIIYFAIDYDMMDGDVTNYVIPYFRGIRKAMNDNRNPYRIGIYGARNVCSRVAKVGYSVSSFVSDMSTGFSGNLGYSIPSNWAFDQFYEYIFTGGGTSFGLDKVAYSGKYSGFDTIVTYTEADPDPVPTEEILLDRYKELLRLVNVTPSISLALEKEFAIDTPIVSITYKASAEQIIEKNPEYAWTSIPVTRNTFESADLAAADDLLDNLDVDIQADFEGLGGVSVVTKLTNEITNGSVGIGIGVEGGFLKLTYSVEELVWATPASSFVLSVQISFLYRNQPATKEMVAQLKLSSTLMKEAFLIIISVYGIAGYIPSFGKTLLSIAKTIATKFPA